MYFDEIKTNKIDRAEVERLHDFYSLKWKGMEIEELKLDRLKIIEILKRLGFVRYDNNNTFQYVRIVDNKIELTTEEKIIDTFEDYITSLPDKYERTVTNDEGQEKKVFVTPKLIQSALYKNIKSYFNLERLRPNAPIVLNKDTRKEKWLYFENTAICVTPDGINTVPYSELQNCIWESAIIPRNFNYTNTKGDFEQFFENICNKDPERKKALMTLIGYLLHDFYECNLRAVLLTDVNSEDIGNDNGRTGKGVLGKSLDQMLNRKRSDCVYCKIPAKNIDMSLNTRYSIADINTQLIHLEDVGKSFDFEQLYNDITDGATIRKQYQIGATIKPVKIMISANRTITISGNSVRGRLIIFELANYYSDKYTPEDEFGHRFFESDWKQENWDCFYSFMINCVSMYLRCGVIMPAEVNYSKRNLIEQAGGEDLVYYLSELVEPHIKTKTEYSFVKKDLYDNYYIKYPENRQKSRRYFTQLVVKYLNLKGIPNCQWRGSVDYIVIYPTPETLSRVDKQKQQL